MIRAIKSVSVQRGRDPRDFTLVRLRRQRPIHAAAIARELGIRRVLVPPRPGVFSAVGLLQARLECHAKKDVAAPDGDDRGDRARPSSSPGWKPMRAPASGRCVARQPVRGRGLGRDALRRPGFRAAGAGPAVRRRLVGLAGAPRGCIRRRARPDVRPSHRTTRPRSCTCASSPVRPSRRRSPRVRWRRAPRRPPPCARILRRARYGLPTTPVLRRGDLGRRPGPGRW